MLKNNMFGIDITKQSEPKHFPSGPDYGHESRSKDSVSRLNQKQDMIAENDVQLDSEAQNDYISKKNLPEKQLDGREQFSLPSEDSSVKQEENSYEGI